MTNVGKHGKKLINCTDWKTKFCSKFHYNGDYSNLYIKRKQICKIRVHNNIPNYYFCIENLSKYFTNDEVSLKVLFMIFQLPIV